MSTRKVISILSFLLLFFAGFLTHRFIFLVAEENYKKFSASIDVTWTQEGEEAHMLVRKENKPITWLTFKNDELKFLHLMDGANAYDLSIATEKSVIIIEREDARYISKYKDQELIWNLAVSP